MDLYKCEECGEIQRKIHEKCIACDDEGFGGKWTYRGVEISEIIKRGEV